MRASDRGGRAALWYCYDRMATRKREVTPVAPVRPDFLILGLAAAGFAIAAYLTGLKWMGGNAAFCLSGSGCDIVQGSRYGTLLGVPTALWGVLMYAAIGGLAALGLTARRWSRAFSATRPRTFPPWSARRTRSTAVPTSARRRA